MNDFTLTLVTSGLLLIAGGILGYGMYDIIKADKKMRDLNDRLNKLRPNERKTK